MIASLELQKSIYRELDTGEYKVFDVTPLNEPTPYILIGNITRVPNDTKTTKGYELSVIIHIYSKDDSSEEAKIIGNFVDNKLLNDFKVKGFHNNKSDLTMDTEQIEEYKDETVYHYIQEYTFILTEKEIN